MREEFIFVFNSCWCNKHISHLWSITLAESESGRERERGLVKC